MRGFDWSELGFLRVDVEGVQVRAVLVDEGEVLDCTGAGFEEGFGCVGDGLVAVGGGVGVVAHYGDVEGFGVDVTVIYAVLVGG